MNCQGSIGKEGCKLNELALSHENISIMTWETLNVVAQYYSSLQNVK